MQELLDSLVKQVQSKRCHQSVLKLTCSILENIRDSSDEISLVHHPLGFFLVKLGQINLVSIRLHIWLPNRRNMQHPNWSIHDHNFNLESCILTGEIVNNIFHVNFNSSHPTNCLYLVGYNDNMSILTRISQFLSCQLTNQSTYSQGNYYSVKRGEYHSTKVSLEYLTATIVLASNQNETSPRVIGDLEGSEEYKYRRITTQPSEFYEIISLLLSKLYADLNQL